MKALLLFLLAAILFLGCDDYLEEEIYELSSEQFNTVEGLEPLLAEGYRKMRFFYGGDLFTGGALMAGTDALFRGRNPQLNNFHRYQGLESTYFPVFEIWNRLYEALNESNTFLDRVDEVYENEAFGNVRKGEAHFQRALWLWYLTELFGDVHLTLEPSAGLELEAERTPQSAFYEQIKADLREAIELLPEQADEFGRLHRPAAEAFLTRIYLYNKEYELASAQAQAVIDNYPRFQLEDRYADMWNTKENSESNTEFIFSVIFTADATNSQPVYQVHSWSSQFLALLGMGTPEGYYGVGFNRLASTRYLVTLFDEADQRGEVMFGPDPLEFRYGNNPSRIGVVWLRNQDSIAQQLEKYKAVREQQAGTGQPLRAILALDSVFQDNGRLVQIGTFFDIRKTWNLTRQELTPFNHGVFNHPVIRIAEMYLIKSEAEMMLGNTEEAVETMNILRRARAFEGQEDAMEITADQLDIDFILDERARELTHEQQRKFDLIRTGKIAERIQRYNPEATGFDVNRHTLLPIPQDQLDAMTPESAAAFGQNPGY